MEGPWAPTRATAAVGAVSATVVARPVEVRWDLGDGSSLTCGPGRPYDPALAPDEQRTGCAHVFESGSWAHPGGVVEVSATVVYDVEWSASTGAGGLLGTLTRRATVPVRVLEAQALIR